jgi:hypothetical protein
MKNTNKKAFTILELLIVTGMIGFMIPVIFVVVFAVVRQEARIYALNTVKSQGDFILGNMKYNIRNFAVSLHNGTPASDVNRVCSTVSATPTAYNPLYMRDREGNQFFYNISGTSIASNSAKLAAPQTLTTSKVTISNFTMSCNLSSIFSTPVITLTYTVNFASGAAGDAAVSLPYSTKIKLRNQ